MTDLALNGGDTEKKARKTKSNAKTEEMVPVSAFKVETARADAAEERIKEMESAPVLLTILDEKELNGLTRQKFLLGEAVEQSKELTQKAADAQAVAVMMGTAYNHAWSDVRKKHGLPEDVDVDWSKKC